MALTDVTARKGDKEATVQYDFGDNLTDAVQKFGENVVFSNYVQSAKITLQAVVRRHLVAGTDYVSAAKTWKVGMQAQRTSVPARVAIIQDYKKMTPEERKAFLAELKSI